MQTTRNEKKPQKRAFASLKDSMQAMCSVAASQNEVIKNLIAENMTLRTEAAQWRHNCTAMQEGAEVLRQTLWRMAEYMDSKGVFDGFISYNAEAAETSSERAALSSVTEC